MSYYPGDTVIHKNGGQPRKIERIGYSTLLGALYILDDGTRLTPDQMVWCWDKVEPPLYQLPGEERWDLVVKGWVE